jgi:hypothetical protein
MGYRMAGRIHAALLGAGGRAQAALPGARERGGERGQGTVEYVALILLVAVVLAGVVAATRRSSIGDGGIARTIVSKLRSALETVR